jgi:hypothetical protein
LLLVLTPQATRLRVATADGPGAGRFLAAALLDALHGGPRLVAIELAPQPPWPAAYGVDFIFDTETACEVIRVTLAQDAQVVAAQLLRCPRTGRAEAISLAASLIEALHPGSEITGIRCQEANGSSQIEILVRTDQPVTVHLGST